VGSWKHASEEDRAPLQPQTDLEPVSDNEEDETGDIQTELQERSSK
jgi:hypothetical protein